MSQIYSKKILDHFRNPRNVGIIKNPSGQGEVGNFLCGDKMHLYIKIRKDKKGRHIIYDSKFQTFGCTVAIANTSLLTTMIKGKTIEDALKISKTELIRKLGEPLPVTKQHCSVLAADALAEAIYDYLSKNKLPISKDLQKTHERIQKQTHDVEERHKGYVEMEEKILRK